MADKKKGLRTDLRDATITDVERRETAFTFNTERMRGYIRLQPVKDSASYSKPREKTRQ